MPRKTQDELKALLLQRVQDIYTGATGEDWSRVCEDESWASASELAEIIPTLRQVFGEPVSNWWVYGVSSLDHFEGARKAAEFLWEHGVRPNKRLEPKEESNG